MYHNDPAKGTIVIPTHLTVIDTSVFSIHTKAIDPIIEVPLKVFPIPVKDYMNIRFMSDVQEFVRFSLIDVTGRAYELGKQYVSQGENTVSIDLKGLSLKKGFYILNMQSDSRQYSRIKIIVK